MDDWNRCDVCGRFISLEDFETGGATRKLATPDSDYTREEYETLCHRHAKARRAYDFYSWQDYE